MSRQQTVSINQAGLRPGPRLCKLPGASLTTKAIALVIAGVATLLCVGGQVGLLAIYSGDAQQLIARLRPDTKEVQQRVADSHSLAHEVVEAQVVTPVPVGGKERP